MLKLHPLLLALLYSCAHKAPLPKEGVSVETALIQARSSYLLGCTQARVELKGQDAFNHCSHKAQKHLEDLKTIMNWPLE